MTRGRPTNTKDLLPSERGLLEIVRALGFGQIEFLQIRAGEPVLDPKPIVVHALKFGVPRESAAPAGSDFDLKQEVADLFEYTRDVDEGEIRALVVRHGLPFSMEIELAGRASREVPGGGRG
jgi:hypothetical protein